jgi:outer membrane protein assembly factor BamB
MPYTHRIISLSFTTAICLLIGQPAATVEPSWPNWRGPDGTGHSTESALPVRWDAKSIVWKASLRGSGQSTPIIWGDRIFLTSALDNGKTRLVFCLSRKDGKPLWEREAWTGTPEQTHKMNGWASASCATDGERVVAFFGKGGLHCYTVEGKHLWSRDLGTFPGQWGTGSSPIIVGNLVIQNCDAAGQGLLMGLDKQTGKTVWETKRPVPERGGWTTPILINAGKRQEIVLNGEKAVTAHDPATGKLLWSCKSFAGRGDPTVTFGKGLVYAVNGQPGDIYSIRPGGEGDVTRTHMAWHTPRSGGRDEPSPTQVGDYLIVPTMSGITTCYECATGKVLWKERLNGAFSSSPIVVGGLVLIQNEAGETSVIEPGPKFKLIGENTLSSPKAETFRASLVPCGGQIFSRSDHTLYCIGTGKTGSGQ